MYNFSYKHGWFFTFCVFLDLKNSFYELFIYPIE